MDMNRSRGMIGVRPYKPLCLFYGDLIYVLSSSMVLGVVSRIEEWLFSASYSQKHWATIGMIICFTLSGTMSDHAKILAFYPGMVY